MDRRLQEKSGRKDFMSYLMQDRAGNSDIQLAAHASDFVYVFPDGAPMTGVISVDS